MAALVAGPPTVMVNASAHVLAFDSGKVSSRYWISIVVMPTKRPLGCIVPSFVVLVLSILYPTHFCWLSAIRVQRHPALTFALTVYVALATQPCLLYSHL